MSGVAEILMSRREPWTVNRWEFRTLLGRAETLVNEPHDVYALRQAVARDGLDLDEKDADQRSRLARAIAHAADGLRVELRDSDDARDRAFVGRLDILRADLSDLAGSGRSRADAPTGGAGEVAREPSARPVDPRDARWEVWEPTYRVYFWRRTADGWQSRECEVSAADVVAVLEWAVRHANEGETSTIFAVVVDGAGARGLVRLAGVDPTRE